MPEVSIILPTYNRVDVIGRAIASIVAQSHRDWELLVIDDGSSDGTIERLEGLDPRIRFIRQANQGVAGARNTGLSAATGHFIAFMDSDDEWRPQFLALTTAYLRAHPDQHWVATESHEDLGDGSAPIHHSRYDIGHIYLGFARSIGSRSLELPPGVDDDYLRIYEHKEAVGAWGREALRDLGLQHATVYSGHTLPHLRWGYLNWLPATVCTRHAIETAGHFSVAHRSAEDLRYFAILSRHFRSNLIAVPLAIKYERAGGNQTLAQSHLATGAGAYRFEVNKLSCFDENFGPQANTDPEIRLLRRHYGLAVAHRALSAGHREVAIQHLQQAAAWRPILWKAWPMRALAFAVPSPRGAAVVYNGWLRVFDIGARLATGRLQPGVLLHKAWLRLTGRAARPTAPAAAGCTLTDSALASLEMRDPQAEPMHPQ
ncbi:glycosyltransferase family 2 protein [uncultured Sphaerotilus sp.]|uniref:glycosyltransferase family 2 protein n=1 Tax=uncultured Sphaerotilus sp. TaxID=474984 RepID=UPI0030CA4A80